MEEKLKKNGKSCYEQLYNILIEEIISKKMPPMSKFYSMRQIGIRYDVNPNTVLKAYKLLEEKGYIYSIKGKGCFISSNYDFSLDEKVIPIMENFKYGQYKINCKINFANGSPDTKNFPVEIYKNIFNNIVTKKQVELFGYQEVQGLLSLRERLADYLEKDDIFVKKDNVLITSGTQQSLSIIIKTFGCIPRKTVVLSAPTYSNAINFFKDTCNILTMELFEDGWDMVEFELLLKKEKIDFVYETFNFQNPTGISWSQDKKSKLLKLAEEYNFFIIEDDCFSEFYYTKIAPLSLKSMDRVGKERVIYIRTLSKLLMPNMSLAIMIPPSEFMEKIILAKYGLDTTTSGVNQKILEIFISDGYLEKHLDFIRCDLKERMNKMVEHLKKLPNIEIPIIPKGGFFIWVNLDEKIAVEKLYHECQFRGISFLPGKVFFHNKKNSNKIRFSFLSCTLDEIKEGIAVMKQILDNYN